MIGRGGRRRGDELFTFTKKSRREEERDQGADSLLLKGLGAMPGLRAAFVVAPAPAILQMAKVRLPDSIFSFYRIFLDW